MNPELRAKLSRLSELSDDELTGVRLELIDCQTAIDTDSAGAFAAVTAYAEAANLVVAEVRRRDDRTAAAEVAAVTASGARGGRIARMAARQGRPQRSPEAGGQDAPQTSLVATGAGRGAPGGTELDREGLTRVLLETVTARQSQVPQGTPGARGHDVIIASADWRDQYPESRRLDNRSEARNTELFRKVAEPDALVATGGICGPVNVDYSIGMIAGADRPIREALPAFQAGRGGLIYRQDFDFAPYESAIGIWTEATDLSPAGATKPIYTVSCPGTQEVYVEAISSRLGFGNMMSRFDPETMAASVNAAMAASAHTAENNLLNLIAAGSTQGVTNTQVLGATRDFLVALTQATAAFRNLHRVPDTQVLRALLPRWARDVLRADLIREAAHQQGSDWNSLMVTDDQIDELFTPYNVKPIWHLDGQSTSGPGVAVNQYFTSQSTGAIHTFPTEVTWYLFYEGAWQLLDGGTLDLGVVRDALLDATNDMELMVEIFETLAFRGFTGGSIQFNTTLEANGASSETIAVGSPA